MAREGSTVLFLARKLNPASLTTDNNPKGVFSTTLVLPLIHWHLLAPSPHQKNRSSSIMPNCPFLDWALVVMSWTQSQEIIDFFCFSIAKSLYEPYLVQYRPTCPFNLFVNVIATGFSQVSSEPDPSVFSVGTAGRRIKTLPVTPTFCHSDPNLILCRAKRTFSWT